MESTREVIQYFFKLMAHLTQGRGTKESSSRMKIREYFLKKKKKKRMSPPTRHFSYFKNLIY